MTISPNQDAALGYAEQGFPVFPLHNPTNGKCSCGKSSCDRVGKHPRTRNGVKDATTDPAKIKAWWGRWPFANIAIATGGKSGIFVLDIDGEEGVASLQQLERIYPPLPETRAVKTGRGEHRYCRHPDRTINNSQSRIAPGLDIRGDGGYIVAPPSIHKEGHKYEWINEDAEIAQAPNWLLSKITEQDDPRLSDVEGDTEELILEGKRNPTLYAEGGRLFRTGLSEDGVLESLLVFNKTRCGPPKPRSEVREIVRSLAKTHRPAAKPKRRNQSKLLNWFQFDAAKFQSNPRLLTMDDYQLGWWLRLQALAWMNEGTLPLDPDKLCKMAGASSRKRFMVEWRDVLFDFEEDERDGQACLVHRDFEQLYAEKLEKVDQTKAAAQAGAAKREEDRQKLEKELQELRQGRAKAA